MSKSIIYEFFLYTHIIWYIPHGILIGINTHTVLLYKAEVNNEIPTEKRSGQNFTDTEFKEGWRREGCIIILYSVSVQPCRSSQLVLYALP